LKRLIRFGLTGLLTTAIAYVVFIGLERLGAHYLPAGLVKLGVHYQLATVVAWAAALTVGFVVNRRFTFGIVGRERGKRDFGLYVVGAVLQLLLSMAGYALLIGQLHLAPTPAFAVNLVATTTFNYLFLRFVTFRRAAPA
jgi:putative flippase GtrA